MGSSSSKQQIHFESAGEDFGSYRRHSTPGAPRHRSRDLLKQFQQIRQGRDATNGKPIQKSHTVPRIQVLQADQESLDDSSQQQQQQSFPVQNGFGPYYGGNLHEANASTHTHLTVPSQPYNRPIVKILRGNQKAKLLESRPAANEQQQGTPAERIARNHAALNTSPFDLITAFPHLEQEISQRYSNAQPVQPRLDNQSTSFMHKSDIPALLQATIGMNPSPIIGCSIYGSIILANRAACDEFGYQHEELLEMNIQDILHDDVQFYLQVCVTQLFIFRAIRVTNSIFYRQAFRDTGSRAFLNKKRFINCKARGLKQEIPYELIVNDFVPVHSMPPSPSRLSQNSLDNMFSDGTSEDSGSSMLPSMQTLLLCRFKCLQQESDLAFLLKVHKAVIDMSIVPIIGIQTDSIVRVFNQSAADVFRCKREDVLGQSVNLLMPDRVAKYHDLFIQNYLKTGVRNIINRTRPERGKRLDGTSFPVELKVTDVHDKSGRRCFVGFVRDQSALFLKQEQNQKTQIADKIYPPVIAARVIAGEKISDYHPSISVLFADLVGFTTLSAELTSERIVMLLDDIFTILDKRIIHRYNVEKIKTIGDCYVIASGVPSPVVDHADQVIRSAIDMHKHIRTVGNRNIDLPRPISLRIGIHSGECTAGIAGTIKPQYDVWGMDIAIATLMESTGVANQIHISSATKKLIKDNKLVDLFGERREVHVPGMKQKMETWLSQLPVPKN